MIWLVGLWLIALGAVLFLIRALVQCRARLAALDVEIAHLSQPIDVDEGEFERLLARMGGSRIVVELTAPIALARQHSAWAPAVTRVAPGWLQRQVYARVAEEMKLILTERGVAAELYVFHSSSS